MTGAILIVSLMLIGGCGWKGLSHQEQEPSYLDNYSAALSQQIDQGVLSYKEAQDLYWAAVERERDRGIQRARILGAYLGSRPAQVNPYQAQPPIDWSQWNWQQPSNQRLQTQCTTYGNITTCY